MECDPTKFRGTMSAVDVLVEQLEDMKQGSTVKAYQLASPDNRDLTANGHDFEMFDTMFRSVPFIPLLERHDYSYQKTMMTPCRQTFDVLLYNQNDPTPTHCYEFSMSRQVVADTHESLGKFKLPVDSQYWRTDSVVPISSCDVRLRHGNDSM